MCICSRMTLQWTVHRALHIVGARERTAELFNAFFLHGVVNVLSLLRRVKNSFEHKTTQFGCRISALALGFVLFSASTCLLCLDVW